MTCSQSQTFTDPPKTSHLGPGEIGEVSPTSLTVSESTRTTALVRAAHRRSRRFKPYTDSSGRHGARRRRSKDHLLLNPADILAGFDHNPDFGPGVTASRLERFVRASNLGCHPPKNVLALLLDTNGKERQDPTIKFSVLRAADPELAPSIGFKPDDEAKVLDGVLAVLEIGFQVSEAHGLAGVAREDVIKCDACQMRREAGVAHVRCVGDVDEVDYDFRSKRPRDNFH